MLLAKQGSAFVEFKTAEEAEAVAKKELKFEGAEEPLVLKMKQANRARHRRTASQARMCAHSAAAFDRLDELELSQWCAAHGQ